VVSAEVRREQILERLADHVLEHGLEASSLRPLAAAGGTSDRMLLYYFADKAEILACVLDLVTQRLANLLAPAARRTPQPYAKLRASIWAVVRADELQPYMRLWLDIAARAARDEPPFRTVGERIARGFLAWGAAQLKVANERERAAQAARLLTEIEGMLVLEAVGLGDACKANLGPR
jgi:AcrR family transcriptional regulator